MRQQLRPRVILPVAVLALLGAGVGAYATGGGGGDGGSSEFVVTHKAKPKPPELVPAAVWTRKANAICSDASRHYRALTPRTVVEFEPMLVKALAYSAEADEKLAALGLPKGRQASAREFLQVSQGGTATVRKLLDALRRGDGKAFRAALRKLDGLSSRFDRLARQLDARVCATEGQNTGFEATLQENGRAMLRQPARALNLLLVRYRAVVVVFYSPSSRVDGAAVYEARAAALSLDVGFLPVNAKRNGSVAKLAEKYGVHASPAVLVLTKGPKVVAHFDGFADRETVAQAVSNALR
jgi:hypothetical protein